MKPLLVLFALLLSMPAHAEIVKCNFTEPFFNLTFNTISRTLVKTAFDDESGEIRDTVVARHVRLVRRSDVRESSVAHFSRYALYSQRGRRLLTLVLNYKGSDGMSNLIYPYAALAGSQHGGCASSTRPAIMPNLDNPAP